MAADDKFMKVSKTRAHASDNSNVHPDFGSIGSATGSPNMPGAGNNPGPNYRGAGAAPLTRGQELKNRKQVNVERLQEVKAGHAAKRKEINATYDERKKAFDKTKLPRGKK